LALESSDLETALKLYSYASNVLRENIENASSPDSTKENAIILSKVLGKVGEVNVSFGDQEGGRTNFLEAIDLLNSTSYDESMVETDQSNLVKAQFHEARAILHLYLGQLSTAEESLNSCKSGIDDLKKCILILEKESVAKTVGRDVVMENNEQVNSPEQMLIDTRQQLCGVHCSIAEIYLTDLCFEPDAEILCESALQAAIDIDTPNYPPDASQTMANLRLSQNRGLDAVAYILEAYKRMRCGCEALADLVGLGNDNKADDINVQEIEQAKELNEKSLKAADSLPGFEFRCQTAKILLECASILDSSALENEENMSSNEQKEFCVEAAIQVLGSLLAENDEVVEIWFLVGCAFSQYSTPNIDAASYYWKSALDMLVKVKSELENGTDMEDDSNIVQLDEINAQIEEINTKLLLLTESTA